MPKDNALMYQSFLSDYCWRCLREPACARMIDLRDKGRATGITQTEEGYRCADYLSSLSIGEVDGRRHGASHRPA